MSKFAPTNRSNDCPVCGDISGNCRSNADDSNYFQCLTHSGAAKFEIINGFKHIGLTKDGLWAQFILEDDQSQTTYEQRQQSRLEREASERAIFQAGLSPDERHAAHTQLLAQLSLHDDDRADLKRRGLSDEVIESGQFRSIEPGQTLDLPINPKTPGVGFGGKKLLTRTAGYLVPARDIEGRILGFQIRNRTGENPKYPWLSVAGVTPVNLPNGEIPITYVCGGTSSMLHFGEGLLKPIVTAEKLGINIVGASGGNFASSPEQLRECISALSPKTLVLCPDAGSIANAHTMRSYKALNDELASLGHELKVLWYEQRTKSDGDIDEISREQFESAQLISWAEFSAKNISQPIAHHSDQKPAAKAKTDRPIEIAKKLTDKAEKLANWLKAMAKIAGLPTDKKPTREAINKAFMTKQLLPQKHTEGIYETLPLAPVNERQLCVLDGQKGTCKSSVGGKSLMDAAKATGQTCLVIVPSRLLSRDASRVLGATCHLDSGAESARYLTTCPESLYKFARQQWDVVIIDEANEDILRTFDGSLGVNPDLCQRVLEQVLKTASTIAIANDQMYRPSVQAVQRLSGILPQEIVTIQRKRAPSEMTIQLYLDVIGGDDSHEEKGDDIPAGADAFYGWLARLIETIEAGGKVSIPCGSQTKARIIDRVLRAYFKGKLDSQGRKFKGQVLDGQHTPTKVKSEFASDPDQWLAEHCPHWLIWTPCFNSGVSMEFDYFDAQFEAISVFEGANAASQRGERVRAVLGGGKITERHVLLSNRGLSAYPDPAIFTAGYWRKLSESIANAKAEPSDMALAKSIGAEKFLSHHKEELIEKLNKKPELFEYWAIQAREIFFKRETLEAEWRGNGWQIEEADFTAADAQRWRTAVEDAKQSIVESKARALAKSKPVAAEGQDLSPYAAVRAKKHHLGEQLGHEFEHLKVSKWLEAWEIAPDDSGGIKNQRINALVRMSVKAPELWATVLKLDTLRTIAAGTEIENLPPLPIPAKEIAAAKLLTACPGLPAVALGTLEAWDKTSQIVKDAAVYLKANAERLATLSKHSQRILGLQFNEATPIIKCFHKALQMAGLTAQAAGRTNKLWRYRLQTADDCQGKNEAKVNKGSEPTYKDLRNLFRAKSIAELQQKITDQLDIVIGSAADAWQSISDELAVMCGGIWPAPVPPSLREEIKAEWVPIVQPSANPAPLNEDEKLLMFRLNWCQTAHEYSEIKANLKSLYNDFDGRYWALLPADSKARICSMVNRELANVS